MLNILKYFQQGAVEKYEFQEAEFLSDEPLETNVPEKNREHVEARAERAEKKHQAEFTVSLREAAEKEANLLIEQAREQAASMMETARAAANREAEILHEQAREAGYQKGLEEGRELGRQTGFTEALAEEREKFRERDEKTLDDVERFFRDAADQRDMMFMRCQEQMCELSLTIAEKIVRVSLQSSSEIVSRMVQHAIEKLEKREWVRVYIPRGDAQRNVQADTELAASLARLSDHVKIVAMESEDPGTCIIELPDEIIDASASTQMENIREILRDMNH